MFICECEVTLPTPFSSSPWQTAGSAPRTDLCSRELLTCTPAARSSEGGENNYDYNFLTCDIQSTCCRKTSLWKCFKGLTVLCSISFGKYLSCRNDLNDYSGKCPSDFSKAKGDRVIILLVLSKILHLYFIIIEKFWGFGLKNMFIFLLIDQSNSFKTV